MRPDNDEYRVVEARADAARFAFLQAVNATKERFQPDRLKTDAKVKIYQAMEATKAGTRKAIRSHPGTVVGVVGAVTAIIFRRPLMALVRKLYRGGSNTVDSYRNRRNKNAE